MTYMEPHIDLKVQVSIQVQEGSQLSLGNLEGMQPFAEEFQRRQCPERRENDGIRLWDLALPHSVRCRPADKELKASGLFGRCRKRGGVGEEVM